MQINDCKRVRKLHFVGIGGAGMSGIAEAKCSTITVSW